MLDELASAQSTVKRLIEAEEQARKILNVAQEHTKETTVQACEQAKQHLEAVRQKMNDMLRSRVEEMESKASTEMKTRLDRVDAEARETERRGEAHFSKAVEMVVSWITNRGF